MSFDGCLINLAQTKALTELTKGFGTVQVIGLGNPNKEGPLLVRKGEELEVLVLVSGDTLAHTCGVTDDNAMRDAA